MVKLKHILKYLRRKRDYMLVYHYDELLPLAYTDLDFQFDRDSRKSTLGFVFTLGGGAVSWKSLKQSYIIDYTMEADGAVAQFKETRNHQTGKHIGRKYHPICEIVRRGDVVVEKIASTKNLEDPSRRLCLLESLIDIGIA
ncbi:hypothetical protein CK203_062532 [Vitis vinifera]|uniref:Retrovirus-related Pol polyprotein from transposon TNT 1-94 n=1 Tax=Vitis vinifera TaxID=29760 RepID=A0A438FWU1_VITVI|nr:hypothetical protein CK203_062532 [Vitis vinifera]